MTTSDRFGLALTTLFVSPRRIPKLAAFLKLATLFKFHKALVVRKYRLLFSSSPHRRKPGPKGPSTELIAAIPRETTVIMIEHDMDTALGFAERITVLHYGSVIVEGTRAEVVADPKTREVYLGD